jgi:uncharacterized protein
MPDTTVLIVPGLRDHVEDHWQTLLAKRLPRVRTVPPLMRDKLSLSARVSAIHAEIRRIDGPVVLVAHSGGVPMVVHWAQKFKRQIKGALLATPADIEKPLPPGYPSMEELEVNGWLPLPRTPLPFPSLVAASSNDPLARLDRVAELSQDWGSRLVEVGEVGHLNPASGYGPWPLALELIAALDL